MKKTIILSVMMYSLIQTFAFANGLKEIEFCGYYGSSANINKLQSRIISLELSESCMGEVNNAGADFFCSTPELCSKLLAPSCETYGDPRNITRFENVVLALNRFENAQITLTKSCYQSTDKNVCEMLVSNKCEDIKKIISGRKL